MRKNIILIGMMGSSKTTTGKALAQLYGGDFFDADKLYEQEYGETVSGTFERHGEAVFRRREAALISGLAAKSGAVLSLGGGAVQHEKAMQAVTGSGVTVFLNPPIDVLKKRLEGDTDRPLIKHGFAAFESLFLSRLPLYQKYADIEIADGDLTPEQTAQKIMQAIDSDSCQNPPNRV